MAHQALPSDSPFPIINLNKTNRDRTPTVDPYQSIFGDCWRDDINKSTALSPLVCVTKLVTFVIKEFTRVVTDTKHSGDWYFYHDTLNLMTANGT